MEMLAVVAVVAAVALVFFFIGRESAKAEKHLVQLEGFVNESVTRLRGDMDQAVTRMRSEIDQNGIRFEGELRLIGERERMNSARTAT